MKDGALLGDDDASPTRLADLSTFDGWQAIVSYLAASDPAKVTVHQGHMPEIEFTGEDTATGIWAMFDWVDDPGRGGAWQQPSLPALAASTAEAPGPETCIVRLSQQYTVIS